MKKRQGIIYIRVSSEEQVQGTSLQDQEERCLKYCKENGIEVVEVFKEEGASAKTTERQKFLEAVEYCRKNKGKIDSFVVFKFDRFARNTTDHLLITKTLLDYGTTLYSVSEPIDDSPAGKLLETMLASFAQFDNEVRTQRAKNGMEARIKQGLFPWYPPVGYKPLGARKTDTKMNQPHPPDPVLFPIIQKGLKLYATGMYTLTDLRQYWIGQGLGKYGGKNVTPTFVGRVVQEHRLKYYAGVIINPWSTCDEDKEYEGQHEPMITKEELFNILQIKAGKNPNKVKKDRYNPLFPLRRTVSCAVCSGPFTGSTSRGTGGKYNYYHCGTKKCERYGKTVKKDILEGEFKQLLADTTVNQEFVEKFKAAVIKKWTEEGKRFEVDVKKYEKELNVLEDQKKRIFEMRESGEYTSEEFQQRKGEIENKITATQISLNESKIEQYDIEAAVSYAMQFISDLQKQWEDMSPRLRPQFQKLIFPEGIYYHPETGTRTPKVGMLFELSRQNVTHVRPVGLEPTTVRLRGDCSTS